MEAVKDRVEIEARGRERVARESSGRDRARRGMHKSDMVACWKMERALYLRYTVKEKK